MTSRCRRNRELAMTAFIAVLTTAIGPTFVPRAAAQENEKVCRVTSISLDKIESVFDGNWQGMTMGSDGACYFGASTHSPTHGAGFFKFDPQSKKLTILAPDMTAVCGEDLTKTPPQGKIHSPIVEADGWLYLTTHLSNYWDEAIGRYTGAHVLGYEMATGKFRDFGIVRPRFSIYSAIGVDPVHKKLYTFIVPFAKEDQKNDGCHLYQIDIATGAKKDLGLVVKKGKGSNYWFFLDRAGNCWFATWRNFQATDDDQGNLFCYRWNEQKLVTFRNVLPAGRLAPNGEPAPKQPGERPGWTWVHAAPDGNTCFFTMGWRAGGDERLWRFDPSKNIETGEAFEPIAYIGTTFLSTALGGDRIYFIQYKNLPDARTQFAETIRDYRPEQIHFQAELHLRSISVRPGAPRTVVDHGRVVDQDGRAARMIESLAADAQGRVFMNGGWDVKSPDEATHQYAWKGNGIWPDLAEGKHHVLQRGEFFAYVDVSGDLADTPKR